MPVEYLMANTGFEPYEVDSFINWSNKKNLKSKMRPLQSQYTQSGKIQSGGAPKKDIEDLAEGGEKSKEYEGNY